MTATLMMYLNQSELNLYQTFLGKGSGIDHNINISKYSSSAGTSYIKLPKELDHYYLKY